MTENTQLQTETPKDRSVRGKFCGYHDGYPVYYSRPHFSLADNNKFVRHLSQKDARRLGINESPTANSAKLYHKNGYIGPDRHKGVAKTQPH